MGCDPGEMPVGAAPCTTGSLPMTDDPAKTQARPATQVRTGAATHRPVATHGSVATHSPVTAYSPELDGSVAPGAAPLTQFSAAHGHSTGFARARALAADAQHGGQLLKQRFLLEDVLGEGGMGVVYKTKDLRKVEAEDPNPYIATKVLSSSFKDHPDAFVALQQETAKSQVLAHPNIVTVHDFDRDGDTLFMTMELLEGEPLDKLLKAQGARGLPRARVQTITRDLCAALAYAHQRQLIHADFKPGNIFVTAEGQAKVLDFGIARAASKESQRHRFDAGQLGALTPAYASIEMVRDQPLTFSDDVYALACVVYEMLVGRHPFNQCSALEAKQKKLKPARPDGLGARQWRALSRALSLERAQRTPSIAQFSREFFPRRGARLLTLALLVAGLSLAGAGWFAYTQYQEDRASAQALAERLARAEQCLASGDIDCALAQGAIVLSQDADNPRAAPLMAQAQAQRDQQVAAEQAAQWLREAGDCLARADGDCGLTALETFAASGGDDSQAQPLRERWQQVQGGLSEAGECLRQRDYACALGASDRVLTLAPGSAQAIEIRQTASLAQVQVRDVVQRVDKLLAEAGVCMERKNYSCTIAKAESALDLSPGHAAALALKRRAQQTQQQLKETGLRIE